MRVVLSLFLVLLVHSLRNGKDHAVQAKIPAPNGSMRRAVDPIRRRLTPLGAF